jgi:hypothetical protein
MAEIGVVLLDIQKIPNNLGAVVEVSYTVTFDDSDLSTNRVFEEVVELIGRDEIRARVSRTAARAGQVVCDSNLVIDDFRAAHAQPAVRPPRLHHPAQPSRELTCRTTAQHASWTGRLIRPIEGNARPAAVAPSTG